MCAFDSKIEFTESLKNILAIRIKFNKNLMDESTKLIGVVLYSKLFSTILSKRNKKEELQLEIFNLQSSILNFYVLHSKKIRYCFKKEKKEERQLEIFNLQSSILNFYVIHSKKFATILSKRKKEERQLEIFNLQPSNLNFYFLHFKNQFSII